MLLGFLLYGLTATSHQEGQEPGRRPKWLICWEQQHEWMVSKICGNMANAQSWHTPIFPEVSRNSAVAQSASRPKTDQVTAADGEAQDGAVSAADPPSPPPHPHSSFGMDSFQHSYEHSSLYLIRYCKVQPMDFNSIRQRSKPCKVYYMVHGTLTGFVLGYMILCHGCLWPQEQVHKTFNKPFSATLYIKC